MPIAPNQLETILKTSFPDAEIEINDLVGEQNHYQIIIEAKQFAGLNKVAQHRLVMQALKASFASDLHAASIITKVKA